MNTAHGLRATQVGALLVSASYGIGFLFGSGEMALTHGMGGALYGLATAAGMLLLAVFAARLWRGGQPIWDWFGTAYGPALRASVALLSVVWMAGVLAAQIHGGVAIARLLGIGTLPAYALVAASIFAVARVGLGAASRLLSLFLLASGAVLVYALLQAGGGQLYVQGPALFVADLHLFAPGSLLAITVAVVALVCTGADYHQFVLAARSPAAAVGGCVIAGLCLALMGFLPAAVVLALQPTGALDPLQDAKQVIPFALARAAEPFGPVVGKALLLGLSAAALGAGAAVLRAMTSALASAVRRGGATPGAGSERAPWLTLAALAAGVALAARGQGIVATMVSVNIVYISAVAVLLVAAVRGWGLQPAQAGRVMAAGMLGALAGYAATRLPSWPGDADFGALACGVGASAAWFALEKCRASGARMGGLG